MKKIKKGDLIWSKMPLSWFQLLKIEKEHRIRPYLVIKKNLFTVTCIPSSSNISLYRNNDSVYYLRMRDYSKLKKDSVLLLNKKCKIRKWKLQDKILSVSRKDLRNIQKNLT